jgi:hypothetical protein
MDLTTDDIATIVDIFSNAGLTRLRFGELEVEKAPPTPAVQAEQTVPGFQPEPKEVRLALGDQRADYRKLFGEAAPMFKPATAPTFEGA